MFKTKKKQVKEIRDLQKVAMETNTDNYMIGLYNGLEFALAILENREPIFESCITKEPEVIERKEQTKTGRTVASGIIRR